MIDDDMTNSVLQIHDHVEKKSLIAERLLRFSLCTVDWFARATPKSVSDIGGSGHDLNRSTPLS